MQRYDSYKDSGIQWLGEIPSHWEVQKMKWLFTERTEKGHPNEPLLAATQNHGVILKDQYENRTVEATKSLDSLKLVKPEDFVISLRSFQGGIEMSYAQGIISPAYTILIPQGITSGYFKHLGKSPTFIALLKSMVTGIREGQNIDYGKLKEEFMPLPSPEEQQAIASYLDTATAKIDEAIAQQQKMIDLLNERKQIIINNAVTKGLNPNAKMKPSGIDWIGNIPEHWEVMRLKHVTSKIGSGSTPRGGAEVYQDSGVLFLRSQNIYNDGLRLDDVAHIVDGVHQKMKGTQVKHDDILYNITGGSIGRCCCYDREDEANVNQHVSIVRPQGIIAKYLMYNLQSDNTQRQLRETLKGGNREGLAAASFKEFLIPTCPKEEQIQIVSQIEKMFVNIDQAIANASKQIALLQERKQIIINDVVTGKVKVCNN